MKNKVFKNRWLFAVLAIGIIGFNSCKDENEGDMGAPAVINKVYLEDAQSSVPDRDLSLYGNFIRLGQTIRLEGSGFVGVSKVLINGYENLFNSVYVSDKSMIVQVSGKVPTMDVDPAYKNKISLVKGSNTTHFDIEVRSASPSVTSISHTMPQAGEPITLYGSELYGIYQVTFPGGIDADPATIVSDDETGKWCSVVVPAGVTEAGAVFVKGNGGGAYSIEYFNYKKGLILNFDDVGGIDNWDASSQMLAADLKNAAVGVGNVSQGNYCPHIPDKTSTLNANGVVYTWISVTDWRAAYNFFAPTTSLSELAIQFDIHVPNEWANSGYLKICFMNGYGNGSWANGVYNYIPWIDGKAVKPFKTTGWITVTIPIDKFFTNAGNETYPKCATFEDLLVFRETATYKQMGVHFENINFTLNQLTGDAADEAKAFEAVPTSVQVYTDNWRIVPLTTPAYSDFPDE